MTAEAETLAGADRIRAVGLRATRPRKLVLALLGDLGGHRSADDITGELQVRGTPLPRTSVYNVLRDLAEHGLAMVADAGPGRVLYEAADRWHHHFVCRECGAVADVECAQGEKPCLDASVPGAELDEAQIIFRGLCARCRARPNA